MKYKNKIRHKCYICKKYVRVFSKKVINPYTEITQNDNKKHYMCFRCYKTSNMDI